MFISDLAFHDFTVLIESAKTAIILARFIAGSLGMFLAYRKIKSMN